MTPALILFSATFAALALLASTFFLYQGLSELSHGKGGKIAADPMIASAGWLALAGVMMSTTPLVVGVAALAVAVTGSVRYAWYLEFETA
jgi:hypothetical protein